MDVKNVPTIRYMTVVPMDVPAGVGLPQVVVNKG